MKVLWLVFSCSVLLLIAVSMLGCGASGNRLQSISINPATASSQAQFIATGMYTDGNKVTPLAALWSPGNPWALAPTEPIRLDSTGKASCLTVPGTFAVWATAPIDPNVPLSQVTAGTPQVHGTAQLSCP